MSEARDLPLQSQQQLVADALGAVAASEVADGEAIRGNQMDHACPGLVSHPATHRAQAPEELRVPVGHQRVADPVQAESKAPQLLEGASTDRTVRTHRELVVVDPASLGSSVVFREVTRHLPEPFRRRFRQAQLDPATDSRAGVAVECMQQRLRPLRRDQRVVVQEGQDISTRHGRSSVPSSVEPAQLLAHTPHRHLALSRCRLDNRADVGLRPVVDDHDLQLDAIDILALEGLEAPSQHRRAVVRGDDRRKRHARSQSSSGIAQDSAASLAQIGRPSEY